MISKSEIEALVERKAVPDSPVLSVYLDTDQSKAGNLKRRFEGSLKEMLRSIETGLSENQAKHFSADAERARHFVADLEPRAKGLILFCDESENFFWTREIHAAVRNKARWSDTPYIVPLLEIVDEYERYGVVLVDRAHARLFTVFIGEIAEHYDALAPASVRRIKSPGTDHLLSEKRFQSKADTHVHWHLKHVAETLDEWVDRYAIDRLLLGGPVEATGELQHLLSKRVRARVVERFSLPVKASAHEVLEEALKVERQVERQMEKQIVEELIGANGHHPVTLGLESTVRALCEERIWRLIYADGVSPRGGQCVNCAMLFARADGAGLSAGQAAPSSAGWIPFLLIMSAFALRMRKGHACRRSSNSRPSAYVLAVAFFAGGSDSDNWMSEYLGDEMKVV
jgi:peptide chain release factor subunit 1